MLKILGAASPVIGTGGKPIDILLLTRGVGCLSQRAKRKAWQKLGKTNYEKSYLHYSPMELAVADLATKQG